uniref:CSON013661 protein n=1 Tax=Culicoides sonorensis TaxID=179676 RepID=A0A336LLA0_CULSO
MMLECKFTSECFVTQGTNNPNMWPEQAQLIIRKSKSFATIHSTLISGQHESQQTDIETIGGFIFGGKLGWTAKNAYLEVISIESGNKIAVFDFDRLLNTIDSYISCVSELHIPGINSCCVAVGLQVTPNGGKICVISVQGSSILGMVDFFDKVTTCSFVPKRQSAHSLRSLLRCFDGCLAVGTDQGKIILLDLCFKRCKFVIDGLVSLEDNLVKEQCHIIFANADAEDIMQHHEQSKTDEIYFGIQLEVLENAGHVQSIVVIPFSMTLVVGLDDGRMILYDLENLQAFHLAYPPERSAPLLYLSYLEPADDPRACIYVWALHASRSGGIGVMHSIMFQHKYIDKTETVYRNFLSCSARLTMPFDEKISYPVACHSITKLIDEEEEQQLTLCLIAWITNSGSTLMIFDLNQWYKEQMPEIGYWRRYPSYTAIFPLEEVKPLDVWLDEDLIVPFNSIQRPEEHFYPNSLSFDVSILTRNSVRTATWPGLQKIVLDNLVKAGSKAILDPNEHVKDMINAELVPQFQEFNVNLPMGIDLKREYLLTIALEYNCVTFLKKVIMSVADGSHIGNVPTEALGLSTITDWIWNRARSLKDISNNYCVPLFDYSGRTIDCGMQKSLTLCTRQLKIVANLMETICTTCFQFIPEHIQKILLDQLQSIKLATDYQELTQWLLNVGLLPEGVWRSDSHMSSQPDDHLFVPYPYNLINSHYSTQRIKLGICDSTSIIELWKEHGGNGIYPPMSLQKMLRVLLIPDIPLKAKHILFAYLFMDINHVLSDGKYGPIVQNLIKFPAVFKMDPAVIKVTQSFWYMDHGDLETAVEELTSPLSQSHTLKQWQRDFAISTLLKQEAPNLALRILKAPGVPVDPSLELKTLLSNDLVSEAFKFQRAKGDSNLLYEFFEGTMNVQKRDLLLDLSLNEGETKNLLAFLEKANVSLKENLQFVYLLQRSNFVDAVSLVDKLMKSTQNTNYALDVPREILTIYHTTLEPTSRQLAYLAYSHPEKFHLKNFKQTPKPLSSKLIRQKLDAAAGIYQRSILSVKEAGNKEMFDNDQKHERNLPFLRRSDLGTFSFVQKTQTNNVVYPEIIDREQKKRHHEDERDKNVIQFNEYERPSKRRKLDESEVPRGSFKDFDVSVLARFNPKIKPKFNFAQNDGSVKFSAANERTPEKNQSVSTISQLTQLRTPIVEKAQCDDSPERHRFTPQSILKSTSHISLPRSITPLSYASRKSFESEEKSIRFAIPGSSTDTTLNSTLQISNQTINTTHEKTLDESVASKDLSLLSKDEFFSPETSTFIDDQITDVSKPIICEAITKLDQSKYEEKILPHTDLSFLADAPHPRPPIRRLSASSQGSQRNSRSNSRSISPAVPNSTMSKHLDKDEIAEENTEDKMEINTELEKSLENKQFVDVSSTPIVTLTQKRSQKSLGRAILEKNLKQQLMSDIFGEYSKAGTSDQTDDSNEIVMESYSDSIKISEVTDTVEVNLLSHEQSGILTGDTVEDQAILKKIIGNESIGTSFGNITMGDSTLRLFKQSSTSFSESSNYEDTQENLSVSDMKEQSITSTFKEGNAGLKQIEPKNNDNALTHQLSEKQEPQPIEQKTCAVQFSEAISINDSDESSINQSSNVTEYDSDETVDKFANVSDQEEEKDYVDDKQGFDEEIEEEYYEEDDEMNDNVDIEDHSSENRSESSRISSSSSFSTEFKVSKPKDTEKADEVISIGSSSEDETNNDEKHFDEIPDTEEKLNQVEQYNDVSTKSNNTPSSLDQGLILTHMDSVQEMPETSYQTPMLINTGESQIYYNLYETEMQENIETMQASTMNNEQISDLLYGEVDIDPEKQSNSLNLAIVQESSSKNTPDTQDDSIKMEHLESANIIDEVDEQPTSFKVKTKVLEVIKSDVANARIDIIKEVYDETVVQPNILAVDEVQEIQQEQCNITDTNENVDKGKSIVQNQMVEQNLDSDEENIESKEIITLKQPVPESQSESLISGKISSNIDDGPPKDIEKRKFDESLTVQSSELKLFKLDQNVEILKSDVPDTVEISIEQSEESDEIVDVSNNQQIDIPKSVEIKTSCKIAAYQVKTHEKTPERVTKTSNILEKEDLIETPEPENSASQPCTSKNDKEKTVTRHSIYAEDPLDKTSLIPKPDDGIEQDFLNKTDIYKVKIEDISNLPRKLRTRSSSIDQKPSALDSPRVKRSLRATSVPKSMETAEINMTPKKSRRISVDTQSKLENIEENSTLECALTPIKPNIVTVPRSTTPHVLTRSASRRLSTENLQEPTTPNRITRSSSRDPGSTKLKTRQIIQKIEEDNTTHTDSTPVRKSRRISMSSHQSEDLDDNKSEVSVKSTRSNRRNTTKTKQEPIEKQKNNSRTRLTSVSSSDISPNIEQEMESYSQTRRLTRRQKAMMNRSQELSKKFNTSSVSTDMDDKDMSDTESVMSANSEVSAVSNKSKRSTSSKQSAKKITMTMSAPVKRSTRSLSKGQPDEHESDNTNRKRKAANPINLEIIPEEDKASHKSSSSAEPDIPEQNYLTMKRTRKATKKSSK